VWNLRPFFLSLEAAGRPGSSFKHHSLTGTAFHNRNPERFVRHLPRVPDTKLLRSLGPLKRWSRAVAHWKMGNARVTGYLNPWKTDMEVTGPFSLLHPLFDHLKPGIDDPG